MSVALIVLEQILYKIFSEDTILQEQLPNKFHTDRQRHMDNAKQNPFDKNRMTVVFY